MLQLEPYTLDLTDVVRLSDDDLWKICAANPDLRIERNAAGQLEIMSPTGAKSGLCEIKIATAVENWNEKSGLGVVLSSSVGYILPNTAMRAPDVSWTPVERWNALTDKDAEKFWRNVPDFLVEIRSPSDRLGVLQRKMQEWIKNGCRLAWLVDPKQKRVWIYRPDSEAREAPWGSHLSGEDVLPGFIFDLKRLP